MTGRLRRIVAIAGAVLAAGTAVAGLPRTATAATGFTAGDIVVYRVGDGTTALTSAAAPVFLDEYAPDGTLVSSTPMPTGDAAPAHALTASGTATSEGLLSLSADGRYLVAPGYDAPAGTAKISGTAAATTPRTVAVVDASGTVDTSTALTDFATGNNPRSATSTNGTDLWVGGAAGGVRYASRGASTSTELDDGTYKNVRAVSVVDGQLYASADPTKAGLTIGTVGTGTPHTSGQSVTNLPFATPPGDPYGFALLTLGDGTAPDSLYEADPTAGAVVKYGLTDGAWTAEGSVPVSSPEGLTANDDNGTVTVYVTSPGATGTTGTLYRIVDASGVGGQLSGSPQVLATLPANEASRGVAFTPGTVIGTGGGIKPPVVTPTITPAATALPAALGDPANPALSLTVGDTAVDASALTVTVTSADQSVAPAAGIAVSGTGADRLLTVTPGAVGTSLLTVTVTAPDGTSASTAVRYGVSADLGDPSVRYFSGAANASAAVDVGGGYAIVADDENDVLRLYDLAHSGPAVTSFDFTGDLPFGTSEIDLEAAARSGDVIYWEGSMSNTDSGDLAPARSTVFATRVSGTGAATTLTYLGAYTGLRADLLAWDAANGNALGLAASAAQGVSGHDADALNVEGMEFATGTSGTAYLGFRAPLEPVTDRHLAMLVPVTNLASVVDGSAAHATFGDPVYLDLGGLGIRDIRANADGTFLIVAGTADGTNDRFVLYTWDGVPGHPARQIGTALPQWPSASDPGSWETIVSVPSPLVAGSPLHMLQDDGDVDFYGDGLTSKTGEVTGLQKSLGATFTYAPPLVATTTVLVPLSLLPRTGAALPLLATVVPSGPAPLSGTVRFTVTGPDGTVTYTDTVPLPRILPLVATVVPGSALTVAGTHHVTTTYSGDADHLGGTTSVSVRIR